MKKILLAFTLSLLSSVTTAGALNLGGLLQAANQVTQLLSGKVTPQPSKVQLDFQESALTICPTLHYKLADMEWDVTKAGTAAATIPAGVSSSLNITCKDAAGQVTGQANINITKSIHLLIGDGTLDGWTGYGGTVPGIAEAK